jgi:hypothetical protein
VVSHVSANPPQAPQAPVVTLPHDVPFVVRLHESVSVDIELSQAPLAQMGVVTERVRVPVSSQVPLKPLQELHAPVLRLPHDPPSVPRMQARDSDETCAAQVPD